MNDVQLPAKHLHAARDLHRRFVATDGALCECGHAFTAEEFSTGLFSRWPVVMTIDFAKGAIVHYHIQTPGTYGLTHPRSSAHEI